MAVTTDRRAETQLRDCAACRKAKQEFRKMAVPLGHGSLARKYARWAMEGFRLHRHSGVAVEVFAERAFNHLPTIVYEQAVAIAVTYERRAA
jgi:hypothetical protein